MANVNGLYKYLISTIEETSITKCTPDTLPTDLENVARIQVISSNPVYTLTENAYENMLVSVLIRGNKKSLDSRQLVDEVGTKLDLVNNETLTDGKIIIITKGNVAFVGVDDNMRYLYNIDFNIKVQ